MSKNCCEKVRMSAMAIRDGEMPQLSVEEIDKHLKSCADCRYQLEQQEKIIRLLDKQNRRSFTEDVCSGIAVSIEASKAGLDTGQKMWPFVVLCLILLGYKIVEVLPGVTAGLVIKLIPLVIIVMFFGLLKQNPFKINQSLKLEGDSR